jgi:hypothetical protein
MVVSIGMRFERAYLRRNVAELPRTERGATKSRLVALSEYTP